MTNQLWLTPKTKMKRNPNPFLTTNSNKNPIVANTKAKEMRTCPGHVTGYVTLHVPHFQPRPSNRD